MKKQTPNLLPEAALIYCLPVLFIGTYVWLYHNPAMAIIEHLYIITLLFLATITLKVLVHRLVSHKKLASLIAANVHASVLSLFIIYYTLVFIGLQTWNRVIAQEFIISYAQQARSFCEVLGFSFELVIVLLALAYVAIAITCYFFLNRFNWHPKQPPIAAWIFNLLIFALFIFFAYWSYKSIAFGTSSSKEPIYLTMVSGSTKAQDHTSNQGRETDRRINLLEERARKEYVINQGAKRKNLVIILVDALRPKNMGIYGYQRDTTPNLAMLEQQGLSKKFTQMRSTCGETACAHASLLGARYIHQFPNNLFSIQELLKRYDYTTNFIISGDHTYFHNIREVYGKVDNYYDGRMQTKYYFNDDQIIIDKTKSLPEWNGKPTMFHYHLLSSHVLGKKYPQFLKYTPYKNYSGELNGPGQDQFTNFYDNGVLQTDAVIQTLLDTLKSKKYLEDSLVVILADHGDGLGEHNLLLHTNSVYEELLHIPLILIPYGYQSALPKQYDGFMSMIDLAPTILHEFDMPIPETWVGKPIQQKQTPQYSFFQMRPLTGFYDLTDNNNVWKYWLNANTLHEYAYNISKDPKEMKNLILSVPSKQRDTWRTVLPPVQYE